MYFIDQQEINAITKVINAKKLFRYQSDNNSECDNFEQEFSKMFETNYALMVTSGTNALIAALSSLGIGPGDEVIIPSYTFVATAAAVTNVGAIPVMANIDHTLCISPKEIEQLITCKTKAIIPVHMDGLACNMSEICNIASKHNLCVVEDCAQAIGGSYKGVKLGSWGDVGCFSLNQDKIISCGEGGLVITKNRKYYEKILCIHDASCSFNPIRKKTLSTIEPFMGSSMRVSEISGAIMRVQLTRLDNILYQLRSRKKILVNALSKVSKIRVINGNCAEGDCGTSLHIFCGNQVKAKKIGQKLTENNILAALPTTRPAHACWKWTSLLGENSSIHPKLNPYYFSETNYSYHAINFLPSIEILTSTLKLDININLTLEETKVLSEKIINFIEEISEQ